MRGARTRRPFDPQGVFIVRKTMDLAGGRRLTPGDVFDNSLVDARRLLLFYNARMIAYEDETARDRWLPPSRQPRARPAPMPAPIVAQTPEVAPNDPDAIPSDWRTMPWQPMLSLASRFSLTRILGKQDALDAIEAELLRREQRLAA